MMVSNIQSQRKKSVSMRDQGCRISWPGIDDLNLIICRTTFHLNYPCGRRLRPVPGKTDGIHLGVCLVPHTERLHACSQHPSHSAPRTQSGVDRDALRRLHLLDQGDCDRHFDLAVLRHAAGMSDVAIERRLPHRVQKVDKAGDCLKITELAPTPEE